MKKTEVVLSNALIGMSIMLQPSPNFAKDLSLHEALQKGLIHININASGGHAEYDVPQCAEGTPVEECQHMIWGTMTPGGTICTSRPYTCT